MIWNGSFEQRVTNSLLPLSQTCWANKISWNCQLFALDFGARRSCVALIYIDSHAILQTFVSLCVDVWRHSSSSDGLPLFQAEGNMNVTQHNKINKRQQSIRNESVKPKVSEVAWFIVFKFHAKNRPKRLITYNANLTFANNHKSQIHPAPIVWQNA